MSWLRFGRWPLLPIVLLCLWLFPLASTGGEPLFAYNELRGYQARVTVAGLVISLVIGKLTFAAVLARR